MSCVREGGCRALGSLRELFLQRGAAAAAATFPCPLLTPLICPGAPPPSFLSPFSSFPLSSSLPGSFVNTEPGHTHKDIQLISSDGSSPKTLDGTPIGCDADFRYWEGRDDFSVANFSAARIRFQRGSVSVWIDARANGNWVQCMADVPVAAPENWYKEGAWMGEESPAVHAALLSLFPLALLQQPAHSPFFSLAPSSSALACPPL